VIRQIPDGRIAHIAAAHARVILRWDEAR